MTAKLGRLRRFIESSAMRCARSARAGDVGSEPPGRPRSTGRASSNTIGASGSGNSSVPRTGTGGTTRLSTPERPTGTTRTGRTVGAPIRSDRCSKVPSAWL